MKLTGVALLFGFVVAAACSSNGTDGDDDSGGEGGGGGQESTAGRGGSAGKGGSGGASGGSGGGAKAGAGGGGSGGASQQAGAGGSGGSNAQAGSGGSAMAGMGGSAMAGMGGSAMGGMGGAPFTCARLPNPLAVPFETDAELWRAFPGGNRVTPSVAPTLTEENKHGGTKSMVLALNSADGAPAAATDMRRREWLFGEMNKTKVLGYLHPGRKISMWLFVEDTVKADRIQIVVHTNGYWRAGIVTPTPGAWSEVSYTLPNDYDCAVPQGSEANRFVEFGLFIEGRAPAENEAEWSGRILVDDMAISGAN
jgi:hypothetical protein